MSINQEGPRILPIFYSSTISDDEMLLNENSKFNENNQIKIDELSQENKSLKINLKKSNEKINELNKKIESLNKTIKAQQNNESSKIKKFKKIILEKNLEIDSFKKFKELSEKLTEEIKKDSEVKTNIEEEKKVFLEEIKILTEKLNLTKTKLFDSLNKNNQLKIELKLVQKYLNQEIGAENFHITENWKGRAEQIISLQNKVSELKEKIDSSNVSSDFRLEFKKSEILKQKEIEGLKAEICELNENLKSSRIKISSLKTRNEILNNEASSYKSKTISLLERCNLDGNLNKELNEQNRILKYHYEKKIVDLTKNIENFEKAQENCKLENSKMKFKLENIDEILKNKNKIIQELEESNNQLESDLKGICGDFLFSCRDLNKEEFLSILKGLETEKLFLLEQITVLSSKTIVEREKCNDLHQQLGSLRTKYSKLSVKNREEVEAKEAIKKRFHRTERIKDFSKSISGSNLTQQLNFNGIPDSTSLNNFFVETDDLKNKLEFSNERIAFLDEQIKEMISEKTEYFTMFTGFIEKSKFFILDHLHKKNENFNKNYLQIVEKLK